MGSLNRLGGAVSTFDSLTILSPDHPENITTRLQRISMEVRTASKDPAVLSYLSLRKAVGIVALALPFALMAGNIAFTPLGPSGTWPHPLFQGSISDYYYSPVGNVLVGALCAIAMFLMCCRGYDLQDEIAGYLACALALGVAFCPTTPDKPIPTSLENGLGWAHEICAAMMFLVLSYFCLFLFTKSAPDKNPTRRKKQRNTVYLVCGSIMIFSMVVMTSLHIPVVGHLFRNVDMLLIFETVCLVAFGVAWLTKGEAILKDEVGIVDPGPAARPADETREQGATV